MSCLTFEKSKKLEMFKAWIAKDYFAYNLHHFQSGGHPAGLDGFQVMLMVYALLMKRGIRKTIS